LALWEDSDHRAGPADSAETSAVIRARRQSRASVPCRREWYRDGAEQAERQPEAEGKDIGFTHRPVGITEKALTSSIGHDR
jgi:predicted RNase H-like nuclease